MRTERGNGSSSIVLIFLTLVRAHVKFDHIYLPSFLVGMAIWEPCNFVSNLAYDRLVVELCNQADWTLSEEAVKKIAEAYSILTFGSSFW